MDENAAVSADPVALFKALSEEVRLRILRVLDVAEFSVVELTEALEAPQSTISRHLATLRKAGLVATRRQGTLVFYSRAAVDAEGFDALLEPLLSGLARATEDRAQANRILERRRRLSQQYFDTVARHYSEIAEPGGSWRALSGALALGYDGKTVADIGAGQGEITFRLAQSAARVYAIDQSTEMIKLLKERAKSFDNVTPLEGDLESLPLEDASCDVVILSQVLHHAPRPRVALEETRRALKDGGRLILIDLVAHEQEWAREKLADHWLGFDPVELEEWLGAAVFGSVKRFEDDEAREGLRTMTITGLKTT